MRTCPNQNVRNWSKTHSQLLTTFLKIISSARLLGKKQFASVDKKLQILADAPDWFSHLSSSDLSEETIQRSKGASYVLWLLWINYITLNIGEMLLLSKISLIAKIKLNSRFCNFRLVKYFRSFLNSRDNIHKWTQNMVNLK